MSLGEIQTLLLDRLSQAWFSCWLLIFDAIFQRQPVLNHFGTDYCANFHLFSQIILEELIGE